MTSIETNNIPTNLDNNKQSRMSPEADIVPTEKLIKVSQQPAYTATTDDNSNLTDFKAEASPFFPPNSSASMQSQDQNASQQQNSQAESKIEEVNSANSKLQWELDKVIIIAKQQHQYINNLQKANMNLKAEAKSLKDEKIDREKLSERNQNNEFNMTTTTEPIQSFDLVSIGKIEQISKAEKSIQRNSSSSRYHDHRDQFSNDQKENCGFDINNMQSHEQSQPTDKHFGGFDNSRTFTDGGDRQQHFSSNRGGRGDRGRGRGGQNRQRGGGNRGNFDGLAHQQNRGDNFQVDRDRQRNGNDFNQNRGNGDRNNNGRGRARNNNGQSDRNDGNRNHQRNGTNYNDVDNFMPSDRHPDSNAFNHGGAPDRQNNRNGQSSRGGQGRGRARGGRDNNRRGGHDANNSGEPFFNQPFQVNDSDNKNSDPFGCSDDFQSSRQQNNYDNQKSSRGGRGRGQSRNNDMRRARQDFTQDNHKQAHSDPFSCTDVAADGKNQLNFGDAMKPEASESNNIFDNQDAFDGQPAKLMSDINKRSVALEENKEKFFDQDDSQLYVIKNSNDFSNRHCFFEDEDQEDVQLMGDDHQQLTDKNVENADDGKEQADNYADAFEVQDQEQVQTDNHSEDHQQHQQQTQNNLFENADPVIIWNNQGDQIDHQATVEEIKDSDKEQMNQSEEQQNDDRVESTEEKQRRELLQDFNNDSNNSQEEDLDQSQENYDWLYNEIYKATQSSDELKLQALLDKAYSFGQDFPHDLSEAECHLASLIDLTDKNVQVEDLD